MTSKPEATGYLAVGSFVIHYTLAGTGHPLILLHGGGMWRCTFRHNIDPLSRHFTVLAPDIPGHGYTRPILPAWRYDMQTVIDALVGLIDTLEINKAHLLGHSWGGGWAINFTRRFPDRVGKLVLIDSSGLNRRERPAWELLKLPLIGKLVARMVTRRSVRKGLEKAFHDPRKVTPEMVESVHRPFNFPHVRQALHGYARNLDWTETETILPHIDKPVLVLWGKEDRYIHVDYGRKMAGLLPDAKLVIIEGCGHSAHEEKPEEVNGYILDFLKDG